MGQPHTNELNWITATASSGNGNCVQVADLNGAGVLVRDSKNPDGPKLYFTEAEWAAFIDGAQKYEFTFR